MKICAYVQEKYSKQAYSNENMDKRQFVGLRVIIDAAERAGHLVEYAGLATVHEYDAVLISLTSDCDWWSFVGERLRWRPGKYKVVVGGPGVLNVRPFLEFADFFVLGRGENVIAPILNEIAGGDKAQDCCIIRPGDFSVEKKYSIKQEAPYCHSIKLSQDRSFQEAFIGCNHKCLFCGYTWHRKYIGDGEYKMQDSLFGSGIEHKERAILDMKNNFSAVDLNKLRTTAIDGFSERLRFMAKKKISKDCLRGFFSSLLSASALGKAQPHKLKIYNICGFPSETEEDILEFIETLTEADGASKITQKQWWIDLHCTPFRPMPATPAACWPIMEANQRERVRKVLRQGNDLKSGIFYQGKNFFAVEGGFIDSLSTVMLSAIVWRGTEADANNIKKIASSKKFWSAASDVKEATLRNCFDIKRLFGEYDAENLPTKYLQTYAAVEKMWGIRPWEKAK